MLHTNLGREREKEGTVNIFLSEKQKWVISANFQEDDGHCVILFVPTLDASFGCSEVSEAETTCYRKRTNFPISFTAPLSGFDLV